MMKRGIIILILIAGIALSIFKIFWLSVSITALGVIIWLVSYNTKFELWAQKNKLLKYVITLVCVFFSVIAIKIFVFDIYEVSSKSMRNVLSPGDKIAVNKLAYGPRLPLNPCEIPWLRALFYINKGNIQTEMDSVWWNYRRFSGYSKVSHNDIVLFSQGNDFNHPMVKRCIALSGDTVLIRKGEVFINNRAIPFPSNSIRRYRIFYNNLQSASKVIDNLKISSQDDIHNPIERYFVLNMTIEDMKKIESSMFIDSVDKDPIDQNHMVRNFVANKGLEWTIDYFGPLVIPSKGMTIKLNRGNYLRYSRTIRKHEHQEIELVEDYVVMSGEKRNEYVFKQNYLFFLGDNRYNSIDSRHFGIIPESMVIGKASCILIPNRLNGKNWDQLLKEL